MGAANRWGTAKGVCQCRLCYVSGQTDASLWTDSRVYEELTRGGLGVRTLEKGYALVCVLIWIDALP